MQTTEFRLTQIARPESVSPSSFLIPEKRLHFWWYRKNQFGNINSWLTYLYHRFGNYTHLERLVARRWPRKWKRQHQDYGQFLHKKCFLPDQSIWETWRALAGRLGLTMCNLFTLIMELDYQDWKSNNCAEEIPASINSSFNRISYKQMVENPQHLLLWASYSFKIDAKKQILYRRGATCRE